MKVCIKGDSVEMEYFSQQSTPEDAMQEAEQLYPFATEIRIIAYEEIA